MSEITLVSIDTAKTVFQVVCWDGQGEVVMQRRLGRAALERFMGRQAPVRVVMEACGGAHHWGRVLQSQGHRVQLLAAKFVQPYRLGQKNDYQDALAIGLAARAKQMRYVGVKSAEQQAVEGLHRLRSGTQQQYVAVGNRLRGLLTEHGQVFGRGLGALRRGVREVLAAGVLPAVLAAAVGEELEELERLAERVRRQQRRIESTLGQCAAGQALQRELAGVGPLTASALVCKVADPRSYASGRQFAAALGLVPRQHSSGGRTKLGGLGKTGDRYVRMLLIHGARAVLRHLGQKQDAQSVWLRALVARRGFNVACVALAHRNARQAWAVLVKHAG